MKTPDTMSAFGPPPWRWFFALAFLIVCVPLSTVGTVVGFFAEVFMIGFRAGQEFVENLAAEASAARKAKGK